MLRYPVRSCKLQLKLEETAMNSLNVTNARKNLYKLIEETASSHQPVKITGKSANAVLVSEEDWDGINETLYLLSIPGMRESIRSGMQEPLEDCSTELDW